MIREAEKKAALRLPQGTSNAQPAIRRCSMGLINDVFEDSLPGLVVGAVATAILMPLVGGRKTGANGAAGTSGQGRGRQLMKAAVRGYVGVADRIKEATAEAREQLSDLAAEVREEREMQEDADAGEEAAETASKASKTSHKTAHKTAHKT